MAEKAIHTAISIVNGYRKIENIYELLRGRKGFEVRTQFNTQNIDFECCECEQSLCISYIDTNVYLKHKPNSESCILKDGHDKDLIEDINRNNLSRESQRHKYLKSVLIEKLKSIADVTEIESEVFKYNEKNDRRKPDVFCKYQGREIAFEVQLSDISQKYILHRYNFYKSKGIYLIWILDNFSKIQQGVLEKDIKYLNHSQNIFEIADDENSLFVCHFKKCFIQSELLEVMSTWVFENIKLDNLFFDDTIFQIYYYDYTKERRKLQNHCERLIEQRDEKNRKIKQAERKKQEDINELQKALRIFNKNITDFKKNIDDCERTIRRLNEQIQEKVRLRNSIENNIKEEIKNNSFFRFQYVDKNTSIVENMNNLKEIRQEVNALNKAQEDNQKKLNIIENLDKVVMNGVEYRIVKRELFKNFIPENKKRLIFVHTNIINSGDRSIQKVDAKHTFDYMLQKTEMFTILCTFSNEFVKYRNNQNIIDKLNDLKRQEDDNYNVIKMLLIPIINKNLADLEQEKDLKDKEKLLIEFELRDETRKADMMIKDIETANNPNPENTDQ